MYVRDVTPASKHAVIYCGMEITSGRTLENACKVDDFQNFDEGDAFEYNEYLYLKLKPMEGKFSNAVRFFDGKLAYFEPTEVCYRVDAQLNYRRLPCNIN